MNKPQWHRRTEAKLYAYPSILPAIAHLEAQIALMSANMVPPKAMSYDRVGPPTTADRLTEPEQYAGSRMDRIGQIEAKIGLKRAEKAAIDAALMRLDKEALELVNKWYFQSWKLTGKVKIWKALYINRDTFFERKKKIISLVAECLGEKDMSSDLVGEKSG